MKARTRKTIVIDIITMLVLSAFFAPSVKAEVDIPDPGLEAAIREELGIGPEDPITIFDLEMLTELDAENREIKDLTGLEYCINLWWLNLNYNDINDLDPLSGLYNLVVLELVSNDIQDISPLSGLTNLLALTLSDNNIRNIQPLVDNPGLEAGDIVTLYSNPLSYKAINTDIPILLDRGVIIDFDDRTPTTLLKVSGDGQIGLTGFTLPEPFVVQVLDQNTDRFEGVPVTFRVIAGGGSLSIENTLTDVDGLTKSTFTLGLSPGTNTVEVTAAEIPTSVTFDATARKPFIADVKDFFYFSIENGTLVGDGIGFSAERRINAVYNMFEEVERLIEEGFLEEAYGQLRQVYRRTDGDSCPPDFVTGPAAPELAELVQYFADNLIEKAGYIVED